MTNAKYAQTSDAFIRSSVVSFNICAGHWSGGHMASGRTADAEVHVSKERLRQQLRASPSKPGICICLGPSFRSGPTFQALL